MFHVAQGFLSYAGGALHPNTNDYFIFGGGHADDWSNAGYRLSLGSNSPAWSRASLLETPQGSLYTTGPSISGYSYYLDGRPSARHTWNSTIQVIPTLGAQGRVVLFGVNSAWGNGNGVFPTLDAFDIASREYTWINPSPSANPFGPNPTLAEWPGGSGLSCAVKDTTRGHVWGLSYGNYGPYRRWNSATQAIDLSLASGWSEERRILGYDSNLDRIVAFPGSPGTNRFTHFNGDGTGLATTNNTTGLLFNGTVVFSAVLDRFVFMPLVTSTPTVYLIHPTTFVATPQTTTGATPTPQGFGDGVNQPHSRFCLVPDYNGVIFFNSVTENVRFMRLV